MGLSVTANVGAVWNEDCLTLIKDWKREEGRMRPVRIQCDYLALPAAFEQKDILSDESSRRHIMSHKSVPTLRTPFPGQIVLESVRFKENQNDGDFSCSYQKPYSSLFQYAETTFHDYKIGIFSFGILRAGLYARRLENLMSKDTGSNSFPIRHLAMRLGERRYACDLVSVQEIVKHPVLEPSLDGPSLLVGMYAGSRGSLPVLDLLGRPPDECPLCSMTLVVFETSGKALGLLADDLLDIIEFNPAAMLPLPPGGNGVTDELIVGLTSVAGSDYYIINLDMVVSVYQSEAAGLPPAADGVI